MHRLILPTVIWLVMAFPLEAQDAQSIVQKSVAAHGGDAALQKLKATAGKAKGTISIAEVEVNINVQSWSQRPDKVKTVVKFAIEGMDMEVVQVLNGAKGWKSFLGDVQDLDENDLKFAKDSMYIDGVTGLYSIKDDKEIKLSPLGDSKVGDKEAVGVLATKKDRPDVKLFFDKKTDLLIRSEYRSQDPVTMQEVLQEKLYSDFKDIIPGLKSAMKVSVSNDGKRFMELEITETKLVDRHEDSVFARPDK